jgi:hypothetical protein
MDRRTISMAVVAIMAVALVGACGSDDSEASIPTAEQLASVLVTEDDYPGDWTINEGPEGSEAALSGVVPEDQRELLPTIELCDAASPESRAAAEGVRWMAFRQLDLAVDDPIQPPDDRSGHMVFVQEFLLSGEPDEIEATFELIREGMEACLGDIPAGDEGPGTAEEMTIPDVGDDRYGVLTTFEEAGGWAEWRLHDALVRQDAVLMLLNVVDIRAGEGVEPYYSIDTVGEMIETAVDKL